MKNNDIYLYDRNIYKNADFNVWMAFPGPESFALSSLGFLWMYKSIDECDDINVEMIFQDTKKTVIHKNALHMLGFSFTFDMDFYNNRIRPEDEIFPWDFIDIGVSKSFLLREWKNALNEKVTPNCKMQCSGCGAKQFGGGVCF